jgi:hypothetical protein
VWKVTLKEGTLVATRAVLDSVLPRSSLRPPTRFMLQETTGGETRDAAGRKKVNFSSCRAQRKPHCLRQTKQGQQVHQASIWKAYFFQSDVQTARLGVARSPQKKRAKMPDMGK